MLSFSQASSNIIWQNPISSEVSKSHTNELPLSDYLKELEKYFEVYILFESDLLKDVFVPHVDFYTIKNVEQTLEEILKATGLDFVKVEESTFVLVRSKRAGFLSGKILDENNQPLTGATVYVLNLQSGEIADLDGRFQSKLPPGNHHIEIRYVGYLPEIFQIKILPEDSVSINFKLTRHPNLEDIVVVGNRFSETSLLKKTTSADVVKTEKFTSSGMTETGQLLQYTVPSFHSTAQTISDGTDHINPATLRGLGSDQLLVLVNGKRRHHSSLVNINGTVGRGSVATDLNAIPAAAIERIEILRDGAATQYGSDAIAGVINIILKKNTNFGDVNFSSGISQEGDGKTFQLNGNYGINFNKKGGFLNVTLDFLQKEGINRSGNYSGKIFGDARDENPTLVEKFFEQTGYSDQRVMSIGSAQTTNASIFLNAEFPIGIKTKLYASGGTSYRMGSASGFYRFPYQEAKQSGLFPLGFSPKLQSTIFDKFITIGLRKTKTPIQVDLSNTFGGNSFDFLVKKSNNASMGLNSPTQARAGGFAYSQNVTNLDLSKKIKGKIPLNLGVGSEFRLENYRQKSGEEASYIDGGVTDSLGRPKEIGFQVFPGFQPKNEVNEYRYNLGIYSSVEAEITPDLQINTALRFEHYSDFGKNISVKIGSRYSINEQLSLRGTFNTGFRAPSMPQVHFSSYGFQFISQGNEQQGIKVAHFNNKNSITQQFGIKPLEVETSQNFSFGMASQILKNLSLTFDVYQINIKNRIVITGRFSADDAIPFQNILEPTGVSKAQFFTNAIDTKTRGVDLNLNYHLKFNASTLHLSAAANFNQTRLHRTEDGTPKIHTTEPLTGYENILFNREEISRIEVAQPKTKTILRAHLEMKKMEWMLALIRFGVVQYIHPNDGDPDNWVLNEKSGEVESRDQIFSPKWTCDFTVKYNFTNRFSINFGGNNIFNIYPDEHLHSANISHGLFQYSRRVQQFGIRGAYWFVKCNFKF